METTKVRAGKTKTQGRGSASNFELQARILQVTSRCLEEIPLEKLTISMICARAGISRPTFYRHFNDRYDVFNWFLRTTMKSSISQVGIVFSWKDALVRFCRAMEANRGLVNVYLSNRGPFSSYEKFIGYLQDSLLKSVALRFPDGEASSILRFQVTAFSRAFVAAFADWLAEEGGCGTPQDEFVACAISIIPGDLFGLLDSDVQGKKISEASLRGDFTPLIEFVAEEFPTDL